MNTHTKNIHATIGIYKTHTLQCEGINDKYIYNELFIDDDPEIDENIEFPVIDDNNKIAEMQDTEIYKHNESPYTEMDDDYIDQKMLLP